MSLCACLGIVRGFCNITFIDLDFTLKSKTLKLLDYKEVSTIS